MALKPSELILNSDGSIYHLGLLPNDIAKDIIFVGNQDRVEMITQHFDSIELVKQQREFKTATGFFKGKRISVISTGIGTDNIDIVLNELDALVNIDFNTRKVNKKLTSLSIVRIGTSGALQDNIPLGSFLMSEYAIDLVGMLHSYDIEAITNNAIEKEFIKQTSWSVNKAKPIVIKGSSSLLKKFDSGQLLRGITLTAGGFYGPQGRKLRIPMADKELFSNIKAFEYQQTKITNLEMETSAIYGLSRLLGHQAVSLNAILANRANGTFCINPKEVINSLIRYTLSKIVTSC